MANISKIKLPSGDTYDIKDNISGYITETAAKEYTDEKFDLLFNNSGGAVDSIMELAAAMEENEDVVEALNAAIGEKANKDEIVTYNDFTISDSGLVPAPMVPNGASKNLYLRADGSWEEPFSGSFLSWTAADVTE